MIRARAERAVIAAMVVALLGAALPLRAQGTTDVKQQAREVSTADVATQLGLRSPPEQAREIAVGASLTFTLVDPSKLATLGVTGVHAGARVTVIRIASDKLRLEIDEIEPVPLTKKATLKMDAEGKLTAIAP